MPNRDLLDLVDCLTDFYAAWSPPLARQGEIRLSLADTRLLSPALLYADSVVIPDPIFEWLVGTIGLLLFEARSFNGGKLSFERGHRDELREAVDFLQQRQGLLSTGLLIPTPVQAERFYEFRALLRSKERDPLLFVSWEELLDRAADGYRLSPTERVIVDAGFAKDQALHEAEQDKALVDAIAQLSSRDPMHISIQIESYVSAFGQAASAQARPLATYDGEWEYYLYRLRAAGDALRKNEQAKLSVVPALATSDLPFIADVSPEALLDIRRNEDAFNAWQVQLSRTVRAVESLPSEDAFAAEAREILNDELLPAAVAVRQATSRSRVITEMTKDMMLKLGLGAAASAGAVQAGVPLDYTIASAGASALLDLTVRAIRPPSITGENVVLAHLLED